MTQSFLGSHGELFNAQAAAYAVFRPTYPAALYKKVYEFGQLEDGRRRLALDLGAGTGQVAAVLAQTFERVLAVDPSEAQISQAVAMENVEYVVGPGEELPWVADASVDLATIGQAFHWMDARLLYSEMRRVLKPTGALAIWGYGLHSFPPSLNVGNPLLQRFCSEELGQYWDGRRALVDQHYKGLEPHPTEFGVVERVEMQMTQTMSFDQMVGYLSTWSSYQTYLKAHPGKADPLARLKLELQGVLEAAGADLGAIEFSWPLFVILAKQPVPLER